MLKNSPLPPFFNLILCRERITFIPKPVEPASGGLGWE